DDPVDPCLDEVFDVRALEQLRAVDAGRDDRAAQPRRTRSLEVSHRPGEGADAAAPDRGLDEQVLAVAEAADRLRGRRVARVALGEADPAREEERPHAVVAELAVDEGEVVG